MHTAKKPSVKKPGRGTSLAERQDAMQTRAGTLRIVRANQEKAQGSLRIKLVESPSAARENGNP
jgi:hypothetical protein